FFQAEDGIRDRNVTGVQTCALPILELAEMSAVHDDGTIGVAGVNLTVRPGELVLLVGQVGAGKSSLLGALAGLVSHTGSVRWNGRPVSDAEAILRPARMAHVAQVPRVLSGTFAENIRLGHDRPIAEPVEIARLGQDVRAAGGVDSVVGHRGVRLSGGQVQRLALARALATESRSEEHTSELQSRFDIVCPLWLVKKKE